MFRIAVFSSKKYDRLFIEKYNKSTGLAFEYFDAKLAVSTASLAKGFDAVCIFVNDEANEAVLKALNSYGIKIIALRCAGFNNVDINIAKSLGMHICRVPEYSPEAVAEHTVGLMLTLSRKFHKAYNRVREDNFSLDGLMGFNLHQKTVGIIGTGKIGLATMRILKGFGCKLLCSDPIENEDAIALGAEYVAINQLFQQSNIVSLHCPLNEQTKHIINQDSLATMQENAMLINTSRGGLVDSDAVVKALKSKHLGYLGIDVYELESNLFFEDLSDQIIQDDIFARLSTFPNVLITGHQGFFTQEALSTIAQTTISSLTKLLKGDTLDSEFLLY